MPSIQALHRVPPVNPKWLFCGLLIMSIKDKLLDVIIPWRAPTRRLSERNDYLVSANNRLGITILAQRKEIGRLLPKKPKQKEEKTADDRLQVAKYLHHVEQERQKLIIQGLRELVSFEDFKRICDKYNAKTDEELAGSYGEKNSARKNQARGKA